MFSMSNTGKALITGIQEPKLPLMARELCYSSEPCWSAERWNCIWKSQSNYWGCQGKKLCDNTRNIWANYAPRSINVRLRLKLMSMSRLTNGCFCLFHTDFTKKKKCNTQIQTASYSQHQQVHQIQKMTEIVTEGV